MKIKNVKNDVENNILSILLDDVKNNLGAEFMSARRGITLIALIITIIIMLILAGVVLSLTIGENSLLKYASNSKEEYKKSQIKEEIELAIDTIQIELIQENKEVSIENIIIKLDENKYLNEKIYIPDKDGNNGIYKGYNFYIDNQTFEVILGNKNNDLQMKNSNYIIFNGGVYIDTGIEEKKLTEDNEEYTIATKVYINKDMQSKISDMGILGNHLNENGFAWQFKETTSNLVFIVRNLSKISVDYTAYYDKWTSIVMTYKKGKINIYFDNELKVSEENMELIPYSNLYIGTGFVESDRTMVGAIRTVKIWKRELQQDEINKIDYGNKNTNIQKNYILKEINFNSEKDLQSVVGSSYQLIPIDKNIGYNVKLIGKNLLDINLSENTILENSEFTIGARLKINRDEQINITHMGILGNHDSYTGIALQFHENSTELKLIYGTGQENQYIKVDYTPYYGKNTDILVTYKDKKIILYLNGEKISTNENADIVPKGNIYLGCSLQDISRGMHGELKNVKIWNKALTDEKVKELNMNINTNIEKMNLLRELDLTKLENINSCGIFANNNYKLIMIGI